MSRKLLPIICVAALFMLTSCGGGMTVFFHDEYNFAFMERVAVIPFDNLSNDQGAGARATRVFISEILAAEAFEVVEPGEVTRVLGKYSTVRTSELTGEMISKIGKELRVQGLFLGTVTESSAIRSGGGTVNKVSMVVRLVETETGATVWSASDTAGGRGFWASLFGTGEKSNSEVTRDCVREILGTLIR